MLRYDVWGDAAHLSVLAATQPWQDGSPATEWEESIHKIYSQCLTVIFFELFWMLCFLVYRVSNFQNPLSSVFPRCQMPVGYLSLPALLVWDVEHAFWAFAGFIFEFLC